MNVYILSVAEKLASQGIAVDVYTRCHGQDLPKIQELDDGVRLIQVEAGPCAPVRKEELQRYLPSFLEGVVSHAAADGDIGAHRHSPYDVVHSHYWLSGWVGSKAKQIWGVPLVTSFHTLAKVKNAASPTGEPGEPEARLEGEQRVVRNSDLLLAPTPAEATALVSLYEAEPDRIRVVAPGVDRVLFAPMPKDEAKAALHLANARLLLFVGRLQPHKGPDVAIRALAEAIRLDPARTEDLILAVVGGPSGSRSDEDEVAGLMELASELGLADRVMFFPPQPHDRLGRFYSAADAVLVPSRSESFGLVALEAQASGTPVIAAAVGGLRFAVANGESGVLVDGHEPADYAREVLRLVRDPGLAATMSRAARAHAERFSWDATANGLGRVYRELANRPPR
jgi:D-inositol-3-phosphate glycosyltransferase